MILIVEDEPKLAALMADYLRAAHYETEWVDDGTRYFKNDDDRRRFFHLCETELRRRGVSYRVIRGQDDARLWAARDAIHEALYEA